MYNYTHADSQICLPVCELVVCMILVLRLEAVVNRMFQRCFSDRQYTQAIGIAIETRRLDILERAITEAVSLQKNLSGQITPPLILCASYTQTRTFAPDTCTLSQICVLVSTLSSVFFLLVLLLFLNAKYNLIGL